MLCPQVPGGRVCLRGEDTASCPSAFSMSYQTSDSPGWGHCGATESVASPSPGGKSVLERHPTPGCVGFYRHSTEKPPHVFSALGENEVTVWCLSNSLDGIKLRAPPISRLAPLSAKNETIKTSQKEVCFQGVPVEDHLQILSW